jgi:hypothetical protein
VIFLVLIVSLAVFVLLCLVVVLLPRLRYSAAIRTWEGACGLGAGLVGCLGLAYALFGPVYHVESSTGESGMLNMVQVGIPSGAFVYLASFCSDSSLWLSAPCCIAVQEAADGRIALWGATMFIVIMTFLTGFSIGLFLLPSTL